MNIKTTLTTLCLVALAAVATLGGPAGGVAFAEDIDVAALWKKNCALCHGQTGKGDTKAGEKFGVNDLTSAEVRAEFDQERMIKAITEGMKDEVTVPSERTITLSGSSSPLNSSLSESGITQQPTFLPVSSRRTALHALSFSNAASKKLRRRISLSWVSRS